MQKRLAIIMIIGSGIVSSEITYFVVRDQFIKSVRTEADKIVKMFFKQAEQDRMDSVFEEIINFNKD